MLLQSKGIVLQVTKYGENSLISKVISEEKGLITLISNRSKNKKSRQATFFQPLSAIRFVCYLSNKSSINRVKEIGFNSQFVLQENPAVNALRFFLAELLYKVIKEEEQNFSLYAFLEAQLEDLHAPNADLGCFHLHFMFELFDHLGIQPDLTEEQPYFDFVEGACVGVKPIHESYCEQKALKLLLQASRKQRIQNKPDRLQVLNLLLRYCNVQLGGGIENLKSKAVLEVVFS